MTDKLKVGIAGYGVVGKRRRGVIDARDDMTTVAVCDRTLGGSGTYEDGVRYFETYQDLLGEELDVLFVAMSNDIAAEVTIAGLEAGLHVFCEKPPGRNVADIEAVVATHGNRPGQQLKYGFNHRYHDSVQDALAALASGEFGDVIDMRGVYGKSQLITFDQTSWRTERALAGGGVLLDQGIHMVDLIRLFGGEFTDVKSFISNRVWGHDVEDNAYALMQTDDGVVAMLHSSASQWRHRFRLEIGMTRGAITLSGILSGSKSYGAETLTLTRRGDNDMGDPHEETKRYNNDPSWAQEVAEFADAVLRGGEIRNGSAEDALRTMQLVYKIYCADPRWREMWHLESNAQDPVK
ncbi:MAG: Gfo/Idh/MocA family oxidoreductase [Rhodospirillales bacterium]|nr:Gfo/Idh/MocA family oxidoreductase [Rhodospirillales bacterium]MBO6787703.1 Gfo/Idh/MocA family oxidoreductase [Rhodospirillales bacterium]